ncbi:MAG: nucleotide sugar dehydrogenase [Propionivibrio sp.]|nr:nucleotide sugar dehydrogenase [Propionivibrio sp.]
MHTLSDIKLAVIGLGYVGLPLAVEFAKQREVLGFDINQTRIDALRAGHDATLEVSDEELREAKGLRYSADAQDLAACNVFIVTVPTPIDEHKRPDLTPLVKASETIGKVLKKGDIVIYESTVYPGATEEDCVPVLEKFSGLRFNEDFYAGYSPERINPGDKEHRVSTIKKVTSGSTPEVAELVDQLYRSIIVAGTHKAKSIRIAEAAKVIENTQRDLNIALMNELSVLFARLDIDTLAVLEAAGTKWNFLPFRPGLVGGHCIGVDPYYLTDKAEKVGYIPQVILAGRRINDNMGRYVARTTIKKMVQNKIDLSSATVGVLGLTFKENCPDIRNSKVIDIIREFQDFGIRIVATDPYADPDELAHEYPGVEIGAVDADHPVDALILAVAHQEYATLATTDIKTLLKSPGAVVADVKGLFDPDQLKQAGICAWRL